MDINKMLLSKAHDMLDFAYAPYSKFKVGAALLDAEGRIFTGCNVENASYGACCCAERTAAVKAVSEGSTSFKAIAVVSGKGGETFPCGICRQFLSEFSKDNDITVILENKDGEPATFLLSELLPHSFELEQNVNK